MNLADVIEDGALYRDYYTFEKLDPVMVRKARELEVARMIEFKVMIDVEEKSATDGKVVSCSWIDHLKRPDLVRSRLVAQEVVKGKKREDVFAGTPPLAALRLLLWRAGLACPHCCD